MDLQPVCAIPCTTNVRQAGDAVIVDLCGDIDAFADETRGAA